MTELIMLAYDYVDDFKSRDYYKEYIELNKLINTIHVESINEFNKVKDEYDSVLEIGRFHPDFKDVTRKYKDAKIKLFDIKDISRYFELDRLIEENVNDLLSTFSESISSNIPVLNKFGFISGSKGGNCSGSCR